MKKYLTLFLVMILAMTFSACFDQNKASQKANPSQGGAAGVPAADQKSGTTTKVGTITQAGGKFFLTEIGDSPKEIESYAVPLGDYVGQTATVTGQYSGDTLFVGSVE
jgi:hypothetical protein